MPSMRANTFHEDELWLRCPFCGDSEQHRTKAHFSINTRGVFHCFRCGKSGKMPMKTLINFYSKAGVLDQVLNEDLDLAPENFKHTLEQLMPGPANTRLTALDRFHMGLADAFLSRRPGGEVVGIALAGQGRSRRVIGHRAFGYCGDELLSTPEDPIRLVEGPYDVRGPRDVCVFGLISAKHIKQLMAHCVILCPDGDVWVDDHKLSTLFRCFRINGATIVGIEWLPEDKDPDQVPYELRTMLTIDQCYERYEDVHLRG